MTSASWKSGEMLRCTASLQWSFNNLKDQVEELGEKCGGEGGGRILFLHAHFGLFKRIPENVELVVVKYTVRVCCTCWHKLCCWCTCTMTGRLLTTLLGVFASTTTLAHRLTRLQIIISMLLTFLQERNCLERVLLLPCAWRLKSLFRPSLITVVYGL